MLYLIKIEFESLTMNFEKAIIFHNQYTNRSICGYISDESGNRILYVTKENKHEKVKIFRSNIL